VIDIEAPGALAEYLHATGRITSDKGDATNLLSGGVETTVLGGGVSNRTVRIAFPSGEAWVVKQALAKLRVAVDWYGDPCRAHREAEALSVLERIAPAGCVPQLLFEDRAQHLVAMSAVAEPHDNWKQLLLAGRLDPDHVAQFGRLLGTIHARAYLERATLAARFDDRSHFESLRLEPYYAYAASQVPAAADFLTALIASTRAQRLTLVHGDYSPKNVLVHDGRLILLDHEVVHWGDPAFDLGFALTHLLAKALHLPAARARFCTSALQFWSAYSTELGDVPWRPDVEPRAVAHLSACLIARAAGRSPLEYLDEAERGLLLGAALALVAARPLTISQAVGAFAARL
jgi:aminoglycoside phosphotransferase (APT) family kinase protein